MKFKRLSPLLLAAPLLLLSACGGGTPQLNFTANWYANTETNSITDTEETLEYEVTFNSTKGNYTLDYDTGSYVTTLTADLYGEEGAQVQVYHLHSELYLNGSYSYGGNTESFEDYKISDVWFMPAREQLRPLKSEWRIHSSSPALVLSAANLFDTYEYSYSVVYAEDMSSATFTEHNLLDDRGPVEHTVELGDKGSFLDNEQLTFALRGITPTTSTVFRTIDEQTRQEVSMTFRDVSTAEEAISFLVNGESVSSTITTVHVSLGYNTKQPGPSVSIVYAGVTKPSNNEYRSVPLRSEHTVMWSTTKLGTMTYTLKSATFNTK